MKNYITSLSLATLILSSYAYAQGYVCAHGGDFDISKPATGEIVQWLVESSGRGPAVIIGAVPLDKDERIAAFEKAGSASVTPIVITRENANDPDIASKISGAKLIFIRGGDQSRYTQWWSGTATVRAIRSVFDSGGVVAGTSAGCAVLGEGVYDAAKGSLSPADALADSRHNDLTLTFDYLTLVPGVLFDTHFTERGRIVRLPIMLEFARSEHNLSLLGIGVDHMTALCISPNGDSKVLGEGSVTLLRWPTGVKITSGKAGLPPEIVPLELTVIPTGCSLTLKNGNVTFAQPTQQLTGKIKPLSEVVEPKTVFDVITKFMKSQRVDGLPQSLTLKWAAQPASTSGVTSATASLSEAVILIDSMGAQSPCATLHGTLKIGNSLPPIPK